MTGLRVLAVDDVPPALDELCQLLRESPEVAEVVGASSAVEALRLIQAERFDAALGAGITSTGDAVGRLDDGDWIKFAAVDFGTTPPVTPPSRTISRRFPRCSRPSRSPEPGTCGHASSRAPTATYSA